MQMQILIMFIMDHTKSTEEQHLHCQFVILFLKLKGKATFEAHFHVLPKASSS